LSLWNEYGAVLREGDILKLSGCFTQIWKNSLQIKVGNKGLITKVGEFMMIFNDQPDMSILSPEMMKEIQDQQQGMGQAKPGGPGSAPSSTPQFGANNKPGIPK
jgi:hypothetical protein